MIVIDFGLIDTIGLACLFVEITYFGFCHLARTLMRS